MSFPVPYEMRNPPRRSDGYVIGPTRRHLPEPYLGEPSSEPGFGPSAVARCHQVSGGVYSKEWVDFHYGDEIAYPVCRRCEEALRVRT